MKVTHHRNGDRSYRFSYEESILGSSSRLSALKDFVWKEGGPYSLVCDVFEAFEKELLKSPLSLSSDCLLTMCKMIQIGMRWPYGKACWSIAKSELEKEKAHEDC